MDPRELSWRKAQRAQQRQSKPLSYFNHYADGAGFLVSMQMHPQRWQARVWPTCYWGMPVRDALSSSTHCALPSQLWL